jgi:hypothetical protein
MCGQPEAEKLREQILFVSGRHQRDTLVRHHKNKNKINKNDSSVDYGTVSRRNFSLKEK